MKFLEQPQLEMLTAFLSGREVGDRILNGRIEAFSCKRAGEDKQVAKMLEAQYKAELSTSPASENSSLGPLSESSSRRLLIDLISTMNASFPDHDFSSLRPEQFLKVPSATTVMASVNTHLAELSETYNSSFLEDLWMSIEGVVRIWECDIYSYVPDMEEDPFSDGNIWTFNYFFFNKSLKRILYFTCIATSKFSEMPVTMAGAMEDSDMEDGDDMDRSDLMEDLMTAGEWEEEA